MHLSSDRFSVYEATDIESSHGRRANYSEANINTSALDRIQKLTSKASPSLFFPCSAYNDKVHCIAMARDVVLLELDPRCMKVVIFRLVTFQNNAFLVRRNNIREHFFKCNLRAVVIIDFGQRDWNALGEHAFARGLMDEGLEQLATLAIGRQEQRGRVKSKDIEENES